jgi:hypothetical protein
VDLDNVRVPQPRQGLALVAEPGLLLRLRLLQHLQRDQTVQLDVPGLVNDPHPAAAQLGEDVVARHPRGRALGVPAVAAVDDRVRPSTVAHGRGQFKLQAQSGGVFGKPLRVLLQPGALAPALAQHKLRVDQFQGCLIFPAQILEPLKLRLREDALAGRPALLLIDAQDVHEFRRRYLAAGSQKVADVGWEPSPPPLGQPLGRGFGVYSVEIAHDETPAPLGLATLR